MATAGTLTPSSGAAMPGKSTTAIQIAAAQTLTTSYAATDWVVVGNFTSLEIWLGWTQDDETSITVCVQTSPTAAGSDFSTRTIVIDLAAGDGTGDGTPHQIVFTRADWTLSDHGDPSLSPVYCHGAVRVQLLAKKTGGSGTVTIQPTFRGSVGG